MLSLIYLKLMGSIGTHFARLMAKFYSHLFFFETKFFDNFSIFRHFNIIHSKAHPPPAKPNFGFVFVMAADALVAPIQQLEALN